jgi:hypothetical protein
MKVKYGTIIKVEITGEEFEIVKSNVGLFTVKSTKSGKLYDNLAYTQKNFDTFVANGDWIIIKKEKEMKQTKKIIGYIAPMDLFGGAVTKGMVYKALTSGNVITYAATNEKGNIIDGGYTNMPKEIVETWKPAYEDDTLKVGDYFTVTKVQIHKEHLGKTYKILDVEPKGFSGNADIRYILEGFGDNDGLYKKCGRRATPTEIEEANKVKVGDLLYIIQTGGRINGIMQRGDILKVESIENLGCDINAVFEGGQRMRLHTPHQDYESYYRKATKEDIQQYKKSLEVIIGPYKAQFEGDHVSFGCQSFNKQAIKTIKNLLLSPVYAKVEIQGVDINCQLLDKILKQLK